LPKKVSEIKKKEIIDSFLKGSNIRDIADIHNFSITTITRQLKNALGENKFKELKKLKSKTISKNVNSVESINSELNKNENELLEPLSSFSQNQDFSDFIELEPLIDGVQLDKQKEVSSKPLRNIKFPKVVYLIVDKEIELKPKQLNDFPEWSFLPNEDLERYTIEIFSEQKDAKIKCNKNQKLLKVPNPNVFLLASKNLKAKGITRIIFEELLISIE